MATNITLEDQAIQALRRLRAQAEARGLPLAGYLQALAEQNDRVTDPLHVPNRAHSPAEFAQWLHDLAIDMPGVPPLPADFSRADIYNDHD